MKQEHSDSEIDEPKDFDARRSGESLRVYEFPPHSFVNSEFESQSDLIVNFRRLNVENPSELRTFKILKRGDYVYFLCKLCPCRLNFKKVCQVMRATFTQTIHRHKRKRAENTTIISEILNFDSSDLAITKKIFMDKYKLSSNQFYYLYRKAKSNSSVQDVISELQKLQYETLYEEEEGALSLLLSVRSDSKEMFKRYGQVVTFDLTYNVIKRYFLDGRQIRYGLGLFCGADYSNRLVIYGFAVMQRETTQQFKKLFSGFFNIMGLQPTTIITDQQGAIESALTEMKQEGAFDGVHLFDTFHIVKNLSRRVRDKDLFARVKQLIFTKYDETYKSLLSDLEPIMDRYGILNTFLTKSDKFAFSQASANFFGFNISTGRSEKANDLLKAQITSERSIAEVVQAVDNLTTKTIKVSNTNYQIERNPVQKMFYDPKLKDLRANVSRPVFRYLLSQYVKSLKYQLVRIDEGIFRVKGHYERIVTETIEGIIKCNCGVPSKTWLLCSHMFKVLRQRGADYVRYLPDRWILPELSIGQGDARIRNILGRPRNSRKNTQ